MDTWTAGRQGSVPTGTHPTPQPAWTCPKSKSPNGQWSCSYEGVLPHLASQGQKQMCGRVSGLLTRAGEEWWLGGALYDKVS